MTSSGNNPLSRCISRGSLPFVSCFFSLLLLLIQYAKKVVRCLFLLFLLYPCAVSSSSHARTLPSLPHWAIQTRGHVVEMASINSVSIRRQFLRGLVTFSCLCAQLPLQSQFIARNPTGLVDQKNLWPFDPQKGGRESSRQKHHIRRKRRARPNGARGST